jgi:hypothetical protein
MGLVRIKYLPEVKKAAMFGMVPSLRQDLMARHLVDFTTHTWCQRIFSSIQRYVKLKLC